MAESLGERLEWLVLGRLSSGVERRQGPAVERLFSREHDVTSWPGPFSGQLDGSLIRLGPRVAEEHLPPSPDELIERGGNLGAGNGREEIGDVQKGSGLVGDGHCNLGPGVSEAGHRQAAQEVQVALAVVVPELGTDAAHECDGLRCVSWHERGRQVDRRRSHDGVTIVPMPSSVNNSMRSTCGVVPLSMWADGTLCSIA